MEWSSRSFCFLITFEMEHSTVPCITLCDIIVDLWLIKKTTTTTMATRPTTKDDERRRKTWMSSTTTKNEAIISFKCPTVEDGKHNNSVVILLAQWQAATSVPLNSVCYIVPTE